MNPKLTASVQTAKDEIENLMSRLTGEIKKIDIEKGVTKASSPEVFITAEEPKSNYLASSTLKNLKNKKEGLNFIKSSLGVTLRKEAKKQISPRVVLRTQTISGFKV